MIVLCCQYSAGISDGVKAAVFLRCDSQETEQETEAGVNRMLIVYVTGFSHLADVRLQEVFYSLFLPL